jgi:hypothetical protein
VSTPVAYRKPGRFADERFRARRKAWLRRVWWAFPLVAVFQISLVLIVAAIFAPADLSFYLGLAIGVAAGTVLVLVDSPPHHVERWRQGAQGEKATARALRPLTSSGWTVLHDLPRADGGNIDHVVVGTGGVYLLESKDLTGVVSVRHGTLSLRRREDPRDGYENPHIAPRARAAAAELSAYLRAAVGTRVWVQPVVVIWATFEQRSIESDGVAWVHGPALREVLRQRPSQLTPEQVSLLSDAIGQPPARADATATSGA